MAITGVITGKAGKLTYAVKGGSQYNELKIKNWQITVTGGAIDVTDSSDTDARRKVPNKRYEWSGSAEGLFYASDPDLVINREYEVRLYAEDKLGDEIYYMGTVIITQMGVSTPIEGEDVISKTINFVGANTIVKVDNSGSIGDQ